MLPPSSRRPNKTFPSNKLRLTSSNIGIASRSNIFYKLKDVLTSLYTFFCCLGCLRKNQIIFRSKKIHPKPRKNDVGRNCTKIFLLIIFLFLLLFLITITISVQQSNSRLRFENQNLLKAKQRKSQKNFNGSASQEEDLDEDDKFVIQKIVDVWKLEYLDFEENQGRYLRRVRKAKPVWEECEDGKQIFTFEEIEQNDFELTLFDASRDMNARIRWNLKTHSNELSPIFEIKQGKDGKQFQFAHICNTKTRYSTAKNLRLCPNALARQDRRNKNYVKKHPIPIHYVISVTATRYFGWLSRYHYYQFKKTQPSTSKYTRLLAADHLDHLGEEIPTFVTKHWDDPDDPYYVAFNKPYSILQQLEAGNPVDEDIVGILDVDICLLEDFSHFAVDVKEGNPLAQTGFMWFSNDNSSFDRLADQFCHNCSTIESMAVPIFIHKNDLKKLARRWIDKTKEIRMISKDGLNGYLADSELQLSQTPEMYGYIFGSSEMRLQHRIRSDIQEYTVGNDGDKPVARKLTRPSIHFSMGMVMDKGKFQAKGQWNASIDIPDAFPENEVSMRLAAELRDARDNLPPLEHQQPAGNQDREF